MTTQCSQASVHLVLDIDETILNPLEKWMAAINGHFGWTVAQEEVEEAGGWDPYLRTHPRYSEFVEIATGLREDPGFNTGLAIVDGAVLGVQKMLQLPSLCFEGYLTTRPESLAALTLAEVTAAGFPMGEVWARPTDVGRGATAAWKIAQLEIIRKRVTGVLVMVDDSLQLGVALRARNEANDVDQAPIAAVVFEGPLTRRMVARNSVVSSPPSHFYVGDWDTIVSVVGDYCAATEHES